MKKLLIAFILILGVFCITNIKTGATMENNVTQVRASHILVDSQKEAMDLKTKIENNEITFEDAAKQFSKCPSGQKGGDLGYFGRGMMVKEFEDAAFEGKKDSVTNPVQTQFGWHLIKVLDKQ